MSEIGTEPVQPTVGVLERLDSEPRREPRPRPRRKPSVKLSHAEGVDDSGATEHRIDSLA